MKRSATLLVVFLVGLTVYTRSQAIREMQFSRLPTPTQSPTISAGLIASGPIVYEILRPSLPVSFFGQGTITEGKVQITTIISTLQNRTVTIIGQ